VGTRSVLCPVGSKEGVVDRSMGCVTESLSL
jgi:hypothetical protein